MYHKNSRNCYFRQVLGASSRFYETDILAKQQQTVFQQLLKEKGNLEQRETNSPVFLKFNKNKDMEIKILPLRNNQSKSRFVQLQFN